MVIRINPLPPMMNPPQLQPGQGHLTFPGGRMAGPDQGVTGTDSLQPVAQAGSARDLQGVTPAAIVKDFGQYLNEALAKVEAVQTEATGAAQRLALGEINDIAEVMIASEKATLALNLTIQVRNKVLEAYQEMMRMPV